MSSLSNVRGLPHAETPSFSLTSAAALFAGTIAVGIEVLMTRAAIRRSRRQLAELDDRLLRDIGLDRGQARVEADKGYWS